MLLLARIGRMIGHCAHGAARLREQMAGLQRERDGLARQAAALAAQGDAIRALLTTRQLNAQVVDRAGLYAVQQRQAVLRQREYLLAFERDRLLERMETLSQRQQRSGVALMRIRQKQRKFEAWADRRKKVRMLDRLRREENESEERIRKCRF